MSITTICALLLLLLFPFNTFASDEFPSGFTPSSKAGEEEGANKPDTNDGSVTPCDKLNTLNYVRITLEDTIDEYAPGNDLFVQWFSNRALESMSRSPSKHVSLNASLELSKRRYMDGEITQHEALSKVKKKIDKVCLCDNPKWFNEMFITSPTLINKGSANSDTSKTAECDSVFEFSVDQTIVDLYNKRAVTHGYNGTEGMGVNITSSGVSDVSATKSANSMLIQFSINTSDYTVRIPSGEGNRRDSINRIHIALFGPQNKSAALVIGSDYRITKIYSYSLSTKKMQWENYVWKTSGFLASSGVPFPELIDTEETKESLLIYGTFMGQPYIESFRKETGDCEFRLPFVGCVPGI